MPAHDAEGDRFRYHIDAFEVWKDLTAEERDVLLAHTHLVRYRKGAAVHRGALGHAGTLHLLSGSLRVYIISEEGREFTMYFLRPGDVAILASTCFLETVACDVYIDTYEDAVLFASDTDIVRRILNANLSVRCRAYEAAVLRLSEMLWKFQQMLFTSADRRLAKFLLEESGRTESDEIHLTHEQTAQYLGTAREVVSRLMREFTRDGIVKTSRGRICILDRAALQKRAGASIP